MKKLSDNLKTVLNSDNISYFHLVKIGPFDNNGTPTTWYHTQIPGGTTVGSDVYTDQNTIMHIDPPRQSASVDRESFKITYSDNDFSLRPLFEKGFCGIPVEIRLGFFNTTQSAIGGRGPGEILPSLADTVVMYAGKTDSVSYNTTFNDHVSVTIECTSPMGALLMIRNLSTNRESLQSKYPEDVAYDELFTGSKGLTLLWGKK